MSNTYTQIYIQVVFAVEGRQSLIRSEYKQELHKYITGIAFLKKFDVGYDERFIFKPVA